MDAAQDIDALKPYIKEASPVLVLEHVRLIDGTGAAPKEDQRIDIESGKITRVEDASLKHAHPPKAKVSKRKVLCRRSSSGWYEDRRARLPEEIELADQLVRIPVDVCGGAKIRRSDASCRRMNASSEGWLGRPPVGAG